MIQGFHMLHSSSAGSSQAVWVVPHNHKMAAHEQLVSCADGEQTPQ